MLVRILERLENNRVAGWLMFILVMAVVLPDLFIIRLSDARWRIEYWWRAVAAPPGDDASGETGRSQ